MYGPPTFDITVKPLISCSNELQIFINQFLPETECKHSVNAIPAYMYLYIMYRYYMYSHIYECLLQ